MASVVKHFDCQTCGATGKITIKDTELHTSDVVYCPVCSADIYEAEDDEDEE